MNEYLDLLQSQRQWSDTAFRSSLTTGVDAKPDQVGLTRRVAGYLGTSPAAVEALPEEAMRAAKMKQIDADTVDTPVTRKAYTDADFAKLAHDDSSGLSMLERLVHGVLGGGRTPPKVGPQRAVLTSGEFSALVRETMNRNPALDADAARTMLAQRYDVDNTPGGLRAWSAPPTSLSSLVSGVRAGVTEGLFEQSRQGIRRFAGDVLGLDTVAADAQRMNRQSLNRQFLDTPNPEGLAGDVYGGLISTAQSTPAIIAGFFSGPLALTAFFGQTAAPAYSKYRDRGGSIGQASLGAGLEGIAEVLGEKLPLDYMVKRFGRAGFGEFLSGMLAREIPSEIATTIAQSATDTAIANPGKTWGDWAAELPDEIRKTVIGTLVQGGIFGGAGALARRMELRAQEAARADLQAETIGKLNELAAANKVLERDPATFERFMESLQESGPVKDLYIDAQALMQSGIAETLAQVSPSVAEQLPLAAASGGLVRIPVAEYATRIAPTDLGPALIEDLKDSPNGFSRREAQEFMQSQAEDLKAEVDRIVDEQDRGDTFKAQVDEVKGIIRQELDATGRFRSDVNDAYASMVARFFAVMGARMGVAPRDLYERFRLRVAAQMAGGGEVLNQRTVAQGRIRRTIDELVQSAESQSNWRTWYDRHEQTLVDLFGTDSDLFQKILSATSQATGVKGNVSLALKAYDQLLSGEPFTGYLPAVIKNLERIRQNEDLAGAKISQYGKANEGDTEAIAVDRHIAMLFFNTKSPNPNQIKAAKNRIQTVATRLGWEPRQVQAALWAFNQVRLGTDPAKVESYDKILEAKADLILALRSRHGRGEGGGLSDRGDVVPGGQDGPRAESPVGRHLSQILEQPAYHGSPHVFDRFSTDKIGTGEGAQAYGWGLYFAENPGIAEGYRKTLSARHSNGRVTLDGSEVPTIRSDLPETPQQFVLDAVALFGGDLNRARELIVRRGNTDEIQWFDQNKNRIGWNGGQGALYQVDIPDEAVARMLDWDKPLSEQNAALIREIASEEDLPIQYTRSALFAGRTGEDFYQALSRKLGNDKAASRVLNSYGIPGIKYLDASSRSDGDGTRNLVVFDDKLVTITHKDGSPVTAQERKEYLQSTQPRLVVQHNTSAEKLLHAARMGGLAVPSIAITRGNDTMTGFGEITLLGDAEMATPGGDTKVFGADIYSPRYPEISYRIVGQPLRKLNERLAPFLENDREYFGGEERIDDLTSYKPFQRYAANKLGVEDPNSVGYHDLRSVAGALLNEVGVEERIFQGFTNSGNRRYIPHTLERVVAILKKELRGGENFNYGVGSVRAHYTPQFRSLAAIRKAEGRLVSRTEFETLKEEVNNEFFAIGEELSRFHGASKSFGYSDAVSLMMTDAARMGLPRALRENGFEDVSEESMGRVRDFLNKLRDLPTEYFEGKITRAVNLSEFKAAVVPDDTDAQVLEVLRKAGMDITTYTRTDDGSDRKAKVAEVARARGLMFQNTGAPRGSYNPATNVITLLQGADLSTFLHESGHFFLETMLTIAGEMQGKPDLTPGEQEVLADVNALLKWFGVPDLATWNNLDFEEKRSYHEQFARGFESYLFEGKSPAIELHGLFQRFRAWLLNIYRELKNLNVQLDDTVRGVMDRMLATTEEIKLTEQGRSMLPLFASAEQAGMSAEEWAAYQAQHTDATNDAIEDLQAKGLRDMQWLNKARSREINRLKKLAAERRREVRMEVRSEVMSRPIYRAWQFLTGTGDEQTNGKISREALDEMYGGIAEDGKRNQFLLYDWKRLIDLKMTGSEGLHPDVVAEQFGFTSGDEMVKALVSAPRPSEEIEGLTDSRMLERYGELIDQDSIEREADKAIHNDARARMVATEVNALAKATGKPKVLASAAREFARATIARLKVRNLKPGQYASAASRAARAASKAMQSNDLEVAAAEKRNQLVNTYLANAASNAQTEIEQTLRYLRKFDGDVKGLDVEYRDQIDNLLERFNFKSATLKSVDRMKSLQQWVDGQREQGIEPEIPEDLLNEAYRTSYQEMTVEQLRGLVDTVKQIEHLGRLKNKLLTAKKNRELQAVVDEITDSVDNFAGDRTAETRTPTTNLGRFAQGLRRFRKAHWKAAMLSRMMDGGEDGGPMWEYFIRTANEAGDRETTMRAEATRQLSEILAPVFAQGKMGGKGQYFPGIGRSLNRESRLAIALNTGNEGNLQRLLGGEGWTLPQILPVLESITPAEWRAVQAVWDHFETYRPQIAAKERRVYGKEPNWVEPGSPVVDLIRQAVPELRGGYYPIKYDPEASQRAEQHSDAEQARDMMRGAYTSATTRRSFTKARAEEVSGRPLLYTLAGLYGGVNEVIHDLTWHEWLIDANKLLRSRKLDNSIRSHYGPEVVRQFKTWIQDIAAGEKPAQSAAEVALGKLRQNISAAGLGYNVMSAAVQGLGFTQSIVRVGAGWIGRGVVDYISSPIESAREVREASEFMRNRAITRWRELNELRNKVQDESDTRGAIKRGTYFLMMKAQSMVDIPTWIGAHEKALAEGNDEARAVALADQAVIDAQGGGQLKDLSAMERGSEGARLFTVFYGFMNTLFNLAGNATMTASSKGKLAADYLLLFTVPAVLGALLKDVLTPGGDDEPEELARKLVAEQISYMMGTMIILREFSAASKIVTGAEGPRDYNGPAGVRIVTDTYKLLTQAGQGEFDDAFRKAAINVLGDLTGLPSAQINRTVTGVKALAEGETSNPAAVLFGFQAQ